MKLLSLIAILFIHSYGRVLSWNNYTGKPYGDENVLAVTAWSIHFETSYEGYNAKYSITPEFDSIRSFTRTSDPEVLQHERGHFKLVQIYARLIENAIAPYQNKPESTKPEKIYNSLCNKLRKMQDLYDMESQHGANKTTQRLWELNIDKEIKRLQ